MKAIADFDVEALDRQFALLLRITGKSDLSEIQALMVEIGHEWFNGNLDPANEHLASEGIRYTLQTMYRPSEPKYLKEPLFRRVDEELHDSRPRLSIELAVLNWRSILGARVPATSITKALAQMPMSLAGASPCRCRRKIRLNSGESTSTQYQTPRSWVDGARVCIELRSNPLRQSRQRPNQPPM